MIMMQPVVMELPDYVAVPVEFEDTGRLAIEALQPANFRQRISTTQQIAIFQQICIRDAAVMVPAMTEPALHVDQVRSTRTTAAKQCVAPKAEVRLVMDEASSVLVGSCQVVPGIPLIPAEVSMVRQDLPSGTRPATRDLAGTRDYLST